MSDKAFDIGFVPKGWTRGQELIMRPAVEGPPRLRGYFMQKFEPLSLDHAMDLSDIAAVDFAVEDAERVDAWRKWWFAKDAA